MYAIFLSILAVGTFSLNSCGMMGGKDTETSESDTDDTEDDAEEPEVDLYSSKDGKFKVNFPGTPEISSQMVPTEAGDIEMFSYMVEKSATEAFMIAYGDYPSSMIDGNDPYDLIEGARDGALEKNVIESNKRMKVDGFPGTRTFAYDSTQNLYYVYEVVLANNRLYQIMAVRDGDYPTDKTIEDFMDSFTITMKKKSE